jgi:arylsulfatase A-like enzyme
MAAVFLLLAFSGCRRADDLRLVRLGAGPDQARAEKLPRGSSFAQKIWTMQQTRPGLAVRPGETRTFDVQATPGSRLNFSFGLTPEAPERGELVVSVTANEQPVYSRRVAVRESGHWWNESVGLSTSGATTLRFHCDYVEPAGEPVASSREAPAWILLGVPRLYVPTRAAAPRRVLLWISQDALRADHLGAYGYARPTSPRFDRFAQRAVLFEHAVPAGCWTLPSLTSQFTSTWPAEHGAVLRETAKSPRLPSIFEALARDGFTVWGVVGSGFVSTEYGLADGFDALSYAAVHANKVNRMALRLLDQTPGGDVALFLHYFDTHHVYEPPPPFDTLFDPGYRGMFDMHNFQYRADLTPADVEHVRAVYDGALRFADTQIGLLLDELERRGLLENAVVVYTADHGEQLQDHSGWFHAEMYDEILHVPLAIRAPALAPRRVQGPVSLIDLAPTLLDLLRVAPPQTFRGRSLVPLMRGQPGERSPVFSDNEYTHKRETREVAVYDGRWKYVLVVRRDGAWPPSIRKERLFDLTLDPHEHAPVTREDIAKSLRARALAYLAPRRAAERGRTIELDAETRKGLEALGYVD